MRAMIPLLWRSCGWRSAALCKLVEVLESSALWTLQFGEEGGGLLDEGACCIVVVEMDVGGGEPFHGARCADVVKALVDLLVDV